MPAECAPAADQSGPQSNRVCSIGGDCRHSRKQQRGKGNKTSAARDCIHHAGDEGRAEQKNCIQQVKYGRVQRPDALSEISHYQASGNKSGDFGINRLP